MGAEGSAISRRVVLGGAAALGVSGPALAASADPRWSDDGLAAFRAQARALGVRAVMVLSGGRTIVSDGEVALPLRIASIRKSFLSALYGMAGIDLDRTLVSIGIDDYQPLTPVERAATVRQLLEARSGIYIPSAAETPAMKAATPPCGRMATR